MERQCCHFDHPDHSFFFHSYLPSALLRIFPITLVSNAHLVHGGSTAHRLPGATHDIANGSYNDIYRQPNIVQPIITTTARHYYLLFDYVCFFNKTVSPSIRYDIISNSADSNTVAIIRQKSNYFVADTDIIELCIDTFSNIWIVNDHILLSQFRLTQGRVKELAERYQ